MAKLIQRSLSTCCSLLCSAMSRAQSSKRTLLYSRIGNVYFLVAIRVLANGSAVNGITKSSRDKTNLYASILWPQPSTGSILHLHEQAHCTHALPVLLKPAHLCRSPPNPTRAVSETYPRAPLSKTRALHAFYRCKRASIASSTQLNKSTRATFFPWPKPRFGLPIHTFHLKRNGKLRK